MKLAINNDVGFDDVPLQEQLYCIANAGFDGFFPTWKFPGCLKEMHDVAKQAGLVIQSVHAPYEESAHIWRDSDAGEAQFQTLLSCLKECATYHVPIMVAHVALGFEKQQGPTELGIGRFQKLLDTAEELGVIVAFENTEGEEYLSYMKERLWQHPAAGFCIDTGHELCYNRGRDMITEFGADGKLICTHFNDNLGVTGDSIFWTDDAHLMPFDGKVNFASAVSRMKKIGYKGWITLELTTKNKPERHTHDIYDCLDCAAFFQVAYRRAKHLECMFLED